MNPSLGRVVRALLLVGGIALAGATFGSTTSISPNSVAWAVPALNKHTKNENHNNDLGSDDNNEDRQLRGQVIELHDELSPPEALVATTGENVWAHLYKNQLHESGLRLGDHVKMRGEYGDHGIFDAYQVDVTRHCCPRPKNDNN